MCFLARKTRRRGFESHSGEAQNRCSAILVAGPAYTRSLDDSTMVCKLGVLANEEYSLLLNIEYYITNTRSLARIDLVITKTYLYDKKYFKIGASCWLHKGRSCFAKNLASLKPNPNHPNSFFMG